MVGRATNMGETQRLGYKKSCGETFFIECCATPNGVNGGKIRCKYQRQSLNPLLNNLSGF